MKFKIILLCATITLSFPIYSKSTDGMESADVTKTVRTISDDEDRPFVEIENAVRELLESNQENLIAAAFSKCPNLSFSYWQYKERWRTSEISIIASQLASLADSGRMPPRSFEDRILVIRVSYILERALTQNKGLASKETLRKVDKSNLKIWLEALVSDNLKSTEVPDDVKEQMKRISTWTMNLRNAPDALPPDEIPVTLPGMKERLPLSPPAPVEPDAAAPLKSPVNSDASEAARHQPKPHPWIWSLAAAGMFAAALFVWFPLRR